MIRASEHRDLLATILSRYGLPATCLEIVPDVKLWCEARGKQERSSARAAKCFVESDSFQIVMRDEQDDSMIATAKSAIDYRRGLDGMVSVLDSDRKYLIHLMLHEIASFVLRTYDQEARDDWAFSELPQIAA